MSHKDAPPLTLEQKSFEHWWITRYSKRGVNLGFGRDKNGNYFSEFVRDAWDAWNTTKYQCDASRGEK